MRPGVSLLQLPFDIMIMAVGFIILAVGLLFMGSSQVLRLPASLLPPLHMEHKPSFASKCRSHAGLPHSPQVLTATLPHT